MARLQNRTALVTGASRGIGRGIAQRLARDGALVAVHYAADASAAQETVRLIEQDGGRAFTVRSRLSGTSSVDEMVNKVKEGIEVRTSEVKLDIVVNNAAQTGFGGAAPGDVTEEMLDRYYAVNAKVPFLVVQRVMDLMPRGGRIVNISSGMTHSAFPTQIGYAMSKGAMEQITLHMAPCLAAKGITINTVAPGVTDNGDPVFEDPAAFEEMARLSAFERVGEVSDIADVVAFVASDDSRWITGSFIDATGGTLLR
ncbi:SDR family oxidoreductase [Streptomyces sp. ET3-23]|uniref:SDR family oxidoreductase n=1 Tax=Streptomyces sp. ET3-23 TaxID=2885643 RepID=UPI001D10D864|nr:SDR family oxidoreductase [Streptomyces sp. ET3-23]MCC2280435.1 SDR family oxidoreductase [Streptomyces sp. ET3-23]